MKYLNFLLFGLLVQSISVYAQAPLDIYNSFPTTDEPEGWMYLLNNNPGDEFYYGGSDDSPSLRLDATYEMVWLRIAESPGELTYYIRSTGFGQPAAPGTEFLIQESVDGFSWSTLRELNADNLNGDFTLYTDTPDPMAHFFRFFYTNKVSGSNIALDEVTVTKAEPEYDARLMIYRDDLKVLSGHTAFMASETDLELTLVNEGLLENVNISDAVITGPDAANFSISSMPDFLMPDFAGNNYDIQILLDGEPGEVYQAELQIESNDDYNPVYVVNLIGYGGSFAPEPDAGPFNLQTQNMTSYGFDLSWSHPNPQPEHYLVLQRAGAPVSEFPEDGEDLDVSEYSGDARVVYKGSADGFKPKNIAAGSNYHYALIGFNGAGDYVNYLHDEVATAVVSTPDDMIGNYYNGINSQDLDFVTSLSNLVFPHQQLDYWDYPDFLINEFEVRDTTENRKVVTGYYSAYEYLFQGLFQWDVLSREHVFAHSWFATYQAFDEMEYTDYHNLFPTHNDSANVLRLNHPFGEVVNVHHTFMEGQIGWDDNGTYVYEPRDFAKGRVARAVFYMLTCYNNQIGGSWQLPSSQDQQLLKDWHFNYLPDGREMARNDYIHAIQGNRNSYIDSVHFACYVDFENMSYIEDPEPWCTTVSLAEVKAENQPMLYPNPNRGAFVVEWPTPSIQNAALALFDSSGRMVWQDKISGGSTVSIQLPFLPAGHYVLKWQSNQFFGQLPMVIHP